MIPPLDMTTGITGVCVWRPDCPNLGLGVFRDVDGELKPICPDCAADLILNYDG